VVTKTLPGNSTARKEYQPAKFCDSKDQTKIKGYIILTFEYHKEGNNWVALCRELGTSTFARNLILARKKIRDAVICHLNCLEEVEERERFFTENKITFYSTKPKTIPKIDIPMKTDYFYQSMVQPVPALVGAES
jgi:hypothetical protein